MFNEELNPALPGEQLLIDSLLMAQRFSSAQRQNEPCRLHQERDALIWAYADGFLGEEGEEAAWEEISECRSCLNRLATVQRALQGTESWIGARFVQQGAVEAISVAPSTNQAITERILSVFNFERVGKAIQKIGEALTVGQLQLVPVLGEVKLTPWKGDLSLQWNELHVTIRTEMELDSAMQPHHITLSVEIRDQVAQPVPKVRVSLRSIRGSMIRVGNSDHQGNIYFSSENRDRFIIEDELETKIGFCLELRHEGKKVSWQLLLEE